MENRLGEWYFSGTVEFDDSAGIWSVDISVRIDDPQSGDSLGVMKAVLGVSLIQEIADNQAEDITSGSVSVISSDGLLLAETSTGHDFERIMNDSINLKTSDAKDMESVFGNQRSGYVLAENDIVGYAKSAGAELYGSVVARFQGFNWTVVVRQPNQIALQPISGLSGIQDELKRSQEIVVYVLAGALAVVLILAFIIASGLSRSITGPLNELRDLAEAVSKGDTSQGIEVHSDDEIKDVAVAFERMRTSVSIMVRRIRSMNKQ